MYENPTGYYIYKTPNTEPSGGTTINGKSQVQKSALDLFTGVHT